MKKLFYILTVLVAALSMTACDKDDNTTYANTAAHDAAGTYVGTWQQISSYSGDTTYAAGTMTISEIADTLGNQCKVSIANDSATWTATKPLTALANVAHAGKCGDLVFNNDVVSSSNGIGSAFAGRLYGNGTAIFSCAIASKIIVVIDGTKYKKNVLVSYYFTGKKVTE